MCLAAVAVGVKVAGKHFETFDYDQDYCWMDSSPSALAFPLNLCRRGPKGTYGFHKDLAGVEGASLEAVRDLLTHLTSFSRLRGCSLLHT